MNVDLNNSHRVNTMSSDLKRNFVQDLILKNPAMAIQDLNLAVKHKFGEGMRLDSIVAIKKAVRAGNIEEIPILNAQAFELLRKMYDLFNRNVMSMADITDNDIQLAEDVFKLLESEQK